MYIFEIGCVFVCTNKCHIWIWLSHICFIKLTYVCDIFIYYQIYIHICTWKFNLCVSRASSRSSHSWFNIFIPHLTSIIIAAAAATLFACSSSITSTTTAPYIYNYRVRCHPTTYHHPYRILLPPSLLSSSLSGAKSPGAMIACLAKCFPHFVCCLREFASLIVRICVWWWALASWPGSVYLCDCRALVFMEFVYIYIYVVRAVYTRLENV